MKKSYSIVILIGLIVIMFSAVRADVETEATFGSGYQGNLFNDSNAVGDAYASAGMVLKFYPSASTQIAGGFKYDAFSEYKDLSNMTTDLSFTIIPIPSKSPLSLTLTGAVAVRKFGQLYQLYNKSGATVGATVGYRLAPWAFWQSSVAYLNTSYTNADYGSNRGVDFGMGLNITFLGSNSLALKADYSRHSFDQPTLVQQDTSYIITDSQDNSETFEITGFSIRYSRPLGERTGINFSVGDRKLQVDKNYSVLGYTVDYLSPWSDLWEGTSFSGGLKHIFPQQIIANFSLSYLDKSFVDVIELGEDINETYWQDSRNDQLTIIGLSVSKSILLDNGNQLTPSLYLGYRNNQSTTRFFDYQNTLVSFSINLGL